MKFAKWVFNGAGVYGVLILTLHYFLEQRIGLEHPPMITHPEFFYGFVGVGLAWQVLFLILATDPVRYRLLMLPSILEKVLFSAAALVLYAKGRAAAFVIQPAAIDLIFATLFFIAYLKTPPTRNI